MSKYMDLAVKGVDRIPGGFKITENSGKVLTLIFKDGQPASEVSLKQTTEKGSRKIKVAPHGRNGVVYTFDRDVYDPDTQKLKQNKVSIGRLIAECEDYCNGVYKDFNEYNHKLRVCDYILMEEPERVGPRFGQMVSKQANHCHDTTISRIRAESGVWVSMCAFSKAHELLELKHITKNDVLKLKHIRHKSPIGDVWYEILE